MSLEEKLKSGQPAAGILSALGSGIAAECLALAGFDFIIIDNEHGPFSEETTQEMVRAVQFRGCKAFVRVKDSNRSSLLRTLDVGADALIIPDVHDVEEVKKIIEHSKYSPLGKRGFGFSGSTAYGAADGLSDITGYFKKINKEKWIIPQCETSGALDAIEEITSLEGVDGIFVGPYDLSIALGAPAQFHTEEFRQGVLNVLKACKKNGKLAMIFAGTPEQGKDYFKMGFDMVAIGTDTGVLMDHCRSILNNSKSI